MEEEFEDFGFDDFEGEATIEAPDPAAMGTTTDEEAFGGFGFDGPSAEPPQPQEPAAPVKPAKRDVIQALLNPRYPRIVQMFEGPSSPQVLTTLMLQGIHMVDDGKFSVEIKDEDEDRGNVLATVQDLSASSDTSVPKTVTFPDPPLMVPGQSYFLVMRCGQGKFKVEVGPTSSTTKAKYKFSTKKEDASWVQSSKDHAILLQPKFEMQLDADPQRGELSNWLDHIKTSLKKGTIARRLSIKKRHAARFFVLDGFLLRYYREVDTEQLGSISLRDVTHIHEPAESSTIFVVELKNAEHTMKCRSRAQCIIWYNALAAKIKALQSTIEGHATGATMEAKDKGSSHDDLLGDL